MSKDREKTVMSERGCTEYVEMAFHFFSLFPESKALRRKEEEWPGCPKWLRRLLPQICPVATADKQLFPSHDLITQSTPQFWNAEPQDWFPGGFLPSFFDWIYQPLIEMSFHGGNHLLFVRLAASGNEVSFSLVGNEPDFQALVCTKHPHLQ